MEKTMIARIWRGATRVADADAYLSYLRQTGIKEYEATPGNGGVQVLRSVQGDEAEWVLISFWETLDAVRAFAGDDIERAVFYPEDERFLLRKDLTVTHYELLKGP
jgi:heme-degrading monooxygenase HmoA